MSSNMVRSVDARSPSFSTNRKLTLAAIRVWRSNAAVMAIIGEPGSPCEYLPGPAKPSMYTICGNLLIPMIGIHAYIYRFKISCLAFVWGSRSQIVVFGAGKVCPRNE